MRVLKLVSALLLVAMTTAQPHPDLNPGPSTAGPAMGMGTRPDVPAMSSAGMPDTSAGPLMTDTTASPVQTSPDTTQGSVDVTTAADVNTTAPPDVTTGAMTTTQAATTAAPNYYPSIEYIVETFKALTESEYFKTLSYDDQMLVLELMSGGEVGKIAEVMDNLGYKRLFNFIYKIPLKYLDNLMQFILTGLEREDLMQTVKSS